MAVCKLAVFALLGMLAVAAAVDVEIQKKVGCIDVCLVPGAALHMLLSR